MIALWVALGAIVGAPLRYLTDRALQQRTRTAFPVGTLTVNLSASFVLGVLAGVHDLTPEMAALIGTGFCGTLSTWSTFAFETVSLAGQRQRAFAALNLLISVVGGVGVAAAGWALAAALS